MQRWTVLTLLILWAAQRTRERKKEVYRWHTRDQPREIQSHKAFVSFVYDTMEPIHTSDMRHIVPTTNARTKADTTIARVWTMNTRSMCVCVRECMNSPLNVWGEVGVRAATYTHIDHAHTQRRSYAHTDEPKQMTNKRTMRVCHEQTTAYTFHSAFPSVEINSLAKSVGSSPFHLTQIHHISSVFQFFYYYFLSFEIFFGLFFWVRFIQIETETPFFRFFVQFLFISTHSS